MFPLFPPGPRSAMHIYGSIIAAVTTITMTVVILRRLGKPTNKLRDKGIQVSEQDCPQGTNTDISIKADHSTGDEGQLSISQDDVGVDHNPNILIPSQASSSPQPLIESEDTPPITLFRGSSNFQISEINANIIRNGDGPFTKIQRNLISDYVATNVPLPERSGNSLKKGALPASIKALPHVKATFIDYQNQKKSGPCFEGTGVALLREMADCVTDSSAFRMYVLSGPAGTGKTTVAYTIASRAADLGLLGASFFFSRHETGRSNAEKFFTTIAYQLCIYDETFAEAIGGVLKTRDGPPSAPQDQLQVLILDPLRSIIRPRLRPILIVVDALDECDEEDIFSIFVGMCQLVRDLPFFRVIMTTRPQLRLDPFWVGQIGNRLFHLGDIKDKTFDCDIRLYFRHCLSLKQIQERFPDWKWCASDEEIDLLVRAAGRSFIIASTAVRYIFDKSASNPAAQMQKLFRQLRASTQDSILCQNLYSAILHNVVSENCDDKDILNRYQLLVGAVIFVQTPLPVSTLSHVIDVDVEKIQAVLDRLQSLILLADDNVPRVHHQSFLDYIMDQSLYEDPCLRIDPRICHTQIAARCFEIMDKYLKYNILGLGDLARFTSNEDGFKENGMTNDQLEKTIPEQLRYACLYWANHLEVANIEDVGLKNGLAKFVHEHMLHWFEVLSLIGKLDVARRAIDLALKLVKPTFPDIHQLLLDALRFIERFFEIIKRSALHIYYSALPFTPRDTFLYRRYKDAARSIFDIEGGPERWDSLIAILSHEKRVDVTQFSLDSTLVVSYCEEYDSFYTGKQGRLKIWDTTTGAPVSTIPGSTFAVADDCSTVASSSGSNAISIYNMDGSATGITFKTVPSIQKLALSPESSRIAAALDDGTIWLWECRNGKLINTVKVFEAHNKLEGDEPWSQLQFSAAGTRLVSSSESSFNLWDGTSGRCIADLQCGSEHRFELSNDSSRIASLSCNYRSDYELKLWNTQNGALIGAVAVTPANRAWAISASGSVLATTIDSQVQLWGENHGRLIQTGALELDSPEYMAFSVNDILAISTIRGIKLYSVNTRSFISALPFIGPVTFSPDCTRLIVETKPSDSSGSILLCDIQGLTFCPPSKDKAVTVLVLSRDCSRLACGYKDGTVELWETSPRKRLIASHRAHEKSVQALEFSPDGRLFVSGSDDNISLWNGGDGSSRKTLKEHWKLWTLALSNSVLVAVLSNDVTLWSLDTFSHVHTFTEFQERHRRYQPYYMKYRTSTVSIAENSALIAFARDYNVVLLDAVNHKVITKFETPSDIRTMTFLPDQPQLVVQSYDGTFLSFSLINRHIITGSVLDHLMKLPNMPLWHGIPVWYQELCVYALSSQHKDPVPILWIPSFLHVTTWSQGPSKIALGCRDGRVIILSQPTSHGG